MRMPARTRSATIIMPFGILTNGRLRKVCKSSFECKAVGNHKRVACAVGCTRVAAELFCEVQPQFHPGRVAACVAAGDLHEIHLRRAVLCTCVGEFEKGLLVEPQTAAKPDGSGLAVTVEDGGIGNRERFDCLAGRRLCDGSDAIFAAIAHGVDEMEQVPPDANRTEPA